MVQPLASFSCWYPVAELLAVVLDLTRPFLEPACLSFVSDDDLSCRNMRAAELSQTNTPYHLYHRHTSFIYRPAMDWGGIESSTFGHSAGRAVSWVHVCLPPIGTFMS